LTTFFKSSVSPKTYIYRVIFFDNNIIDTAVTTISSVLWLRNCVAKADDVTVGDTNGVGSPVGRVEKMTHFDPPLYHVSIFLETKTQRRPILFIGKQEYRNILYFSTTTDYREIRKSSTSDRI
jgi:hypothetical protein